MRYGEFSEHEKKVLQDLGIYLSKFDKLITFKQQINCYRTRLFKEYKMGLLSEQQLKEADKTIQKLLKGF